MAGPSISDPSHTPWPARAIVALLSAGLLCSCGIRHFGRSPTPTGDERTRPRATMTTTRADDACAQLDPCLQSARDGRCEPIATCCYGDLDCGGDQLCERAAGSPAGRCVPGR